MSSAVAPFSCSLESENLGWERDEGDSHADLTAYFSVEWINKSSKLIEGFARKSEMVSERINTFYLQYFTMIQIELNVMNFSSFYLGKHMGNRLHRG